MEIDQTNVLADSLCFCIYFVCMYNCLRGQEEISQLFGLFAMDVVYVLLLHLATPISNYA